MTQEQVIHKLLLSLVTDKYFSEFRVVEGFNQQPDGLPLAEWVRKRYGHDVLSYLKLHARTP